MSAHSIIVRAVMQQRADARGDEYALRRWTKRCGRELGALSASVQAAADVADLAELERLADLVLVAFAGKPQYQPWARDELRTLVTTIAARGRKS